MINSACVAFPALKIARPQPESNKPVELCANETTVSVTGDGTEPDDEDAKSIECRCSSRAKARMTRISTPSGEIPPLSMTYGNKSPY